MISIKKTASLFLNSRAAPAIFVMIGTVLCILLLKNETSDHRNYFIPWMKAIQSKGISSLSAEFSNYTPPYIYLMYVVSPLVPKLGVAISMKIIDIVFILFASMISYHLTYCLSNRTYAILSASMMFSIPTVIANSFAWGQSDIIYGSLILGSTWAVITGRSIACGAFLGAALSFKLQTVFVFPAFLYLFLLGKIRLETIFVSIVSYIILMTPAMLSGRSLLNILEVYVGQADYYHSLSMNAPNPWYIIQKFDLISYADGTRVGLLLAATIGAVIPILLTFKRVSKADFILVMSFFATLMPYVLPKMHDRYFFLADILLFTLAFVRPRLWWLAALAQIGSLSAYCEYFGVSRFIPIPKDITLLGGVAFGVILVVLGRELWRLPASSRESRPISWIFAGPVAALYRSPLTWPDERPETAGGPLV